MANAGKCVGMREGVAQYLGKARKCSCGRVHETPLKRVVIEQDALQKVPGILEELGYHRVFLVADQNTWKTAGEALEQERRLPVKHWYFRSRSRFPMRVI